MSSKCPTTNDKLPIQTGRYPGQTQNSGHTVRTTQLDNQIEIKSRNALLKMIVDKF